MNIEERIKKYTKILGITAFEEPVAQVLMEEIRPYCDAVEQDTFGNVIGIRYGQKGDKKFMLEAHMDRIGLMVSQINENGRLSFVNLGGVDERILPYARVEIFADGEKIPGIIGTGVHDGKKSLKVEELWIDTGMEEAEVRKKIHPGDIVMLTAETENLCGDTLCGSAMDNRAGVTAVIDALVRLKDAVLPYTLYCVFTTQEELGLHGAFAVTGRIQPDIAIAVDVTHGMTPDTKDEIGVFPLGSGAAICRGPNFHYGLTRKVISLAQNKEIPHTIEVAGGPSGTTAWAIQLGKDGVPVMLISIPLRYMHTNVETLRLCDVQAVSDLLVAAVEGGAFDV